MCAAILCFDDLASAYGTRGWATRAAGYRAAISCQGYSRRFDTLPANSGLPRITDINRPTGLVRFVPCVDLPDRTSRESIELGQTIAYIIPGCFRTHENMSGWSNRGTIDQGSQGNVQIGAVADQRVEK